MIASTLAKQLDTIDVKLPQAKGKTENRTAVAVTINANNRFFIDGNSVSKRNVKNTLLSELKKENKRVIILRAEKSVDIEQVVYVMDIANQNPHYIVSPLNTTITPTIDDYEYELSTNNDVQWGITNNNTDFILFRLIPSTCYSMRYILSDAE